MTMTLNNTDTANDLNVPKVEIVLHKHNITSCCEEELLDLEEVNAPHVGEDEEDRFSNQAGSLLNKRNVTAAALFVLCIVGFSTAVTVASSNSNIAAVQAQPTNTKSSKAPNAKSSKTPKVTSKTSKSANKNTSTSPSVSLVPSMSRTLAPSDQPSSVPSVMPSSDPSSDPSDQPSDQPSSVPSVEPSSDPSTQPSSVPSAKPSSDPSTQPSDQPSSAPSVEPSSDPSDQPSSVPSAKPSSDPSTQPSEQPSTSSAPSSCVALTLGAEDTDIENKFLSSTNTNAYGSFEQLSKQSFFDCGATGEDIKNLLLSANVSGSDSINDAISPQGKALYWLTCEDSITPPLQPGIDDAQIIQRYILAVFYYSFKGDGWRNNSGWMGGSNECDWHKVECISGVVDNLKFTDQFRDGNGSIPPELGRLTSLRVLYLDENNLVGSIPSEIGQLTSLEELWLDVNRLDGTIPSELGQLTSLLDLKLHENSLVGTIPPELGRLASLKNLYVKENNLSGTIPSELGCLTSLDTLWVHWSSLDGTIPVEVCNLNYEAGIWGLVADCEMCDVSASGCCTSCFPRPT